MPVSLDGFVAGPNGEVDWIFRTSGGDDSTAWVLDTLRGVGVHIMGSRSYHDMAAFWPYSDMPIAAPMNDIPKLIFFEDRAEEHTGGSDAGAPVEMHLYAHDGHAFGLRSTADQITRWPALAETWLRTIGMIPAAGR